MARFRFFGRASEPAEPPPAWPRALPVYGSHGRSRPATWAARPVRSFGEPSPDDRPTDPYGFPPVPPPARGARQAPRLPDPREAAALAAAFAVDYLSWDEDDPDRRGHVLAEYLNDPGGDPARLGWSGRGRQRAELALAGLVRPDGDGRVLVDVRVRVTPYRAVGEHRPDPAGPAVEVAGVPAVAPAPAARGWRSLPSVWVRLSVPVAVERGRAVIDAWDEALGADAAEPERPGSRPSAEDHVLQDDDPLADPADPGRSGW